MHRYIASIVAVVAFFVLTACSGKGSDAQGNVPDKMVRTHGDSLALAARFTGDFEHFLCTIYWRLRAFPGRHRQSGALPCSSSHSQACLAIFFCYIKKNIYLCGQNS